MTHGNGQVRRVLFVAQWGALWGSMWVGDESAVEVAPGPGEARIVRLTPWVTRAPLTPACGCRRP